MEKIITYDTLRYFTYSNDQICPQPAHAVVLAFFGLGGMKMFDEENDDGKFYAERGILYVVPYNNPWAWMNRQAVRYTDEILDVLFEKYHLPEMTPIVSTGASMGGQSALVYARYAKRTPTACVVNCPVCDLPYHYTERPDLPRTLYSAFYHEEGVLDKALRAASPCHLVDTLPRIFYSVYHCEEDRAVNLEKHSGKFVRAMTERGLNVKFTTVPGRGHGDLSPEAWEAYRQDIVAAALGEGGI